MTKKIVLASASPRRRELLKKLIRSFTIVPSSVDEAKITAHSPEAFVIKAALAKAGDVALKKQNTIVIGADTIVVLGKKILGKPKNKKEAINTLKKLVGKTHQVMTGLAIVETETGQKSTGLEITKVTMKKVSDQEIKAYVDSGRPLDKAGSYGIQEIEETFIAKVDGDYENVVGLPLQLLKRLLTPFLKS
jgi:septum formation protein